jgi:hypothetical protein
MKTQGRVGAERQASNINKELGTIKEDYKLTWVTTVFRNQPQNSYSWEESLPSRANLYYVSLIQKILIRRKNRWLSPTTNTFTCSFNHYATSISEY